ASAYIGRSRPARCWIGRQPGKGPGGTATAIALPIVLSRWDNLYATGTQIALDLAGGIVAARADDAAARMRGGAAEIQPTDRRAVVGVSRQRAREKQLVQRHRALENVAARET